MLPERQQPPAAARHNPVATVVVMSTTEVQQQQNQRVEVRPLAAAAQARHLAGLPRAQDPWG